MSPFLMLSIRIAEYLKSLRKLAVTGFYGSNKQSYVTKSGSELFLIFSKGVEKFHIGSDLMHSTSSFSSNRR